MERNSSSRRVGGAAGTSRRILSTPPRAYIRRPARTSGPPGRAGRRALARKRNEVPPKGLAQALPIIDMAQAPATGLRAADGFSHLRLLRSMVLAPAGFGDSRGALQTNPEHQCRPSAGNGGAKEEPG